MPAHEIASYRDPLDLLRRFAPTPLNVAFPLDCSSVVLETNDLSFFPSETAARPSSSEVSPIDSRLSPCLWKIVRDTDNHHKLAEASIVMAGNLIVYSFGPACIIAADRERHEVLAFVGTEADVRIFQEAIFPALVRLTEFVTRGISPSSTTGRAAAHVSEGDTCNA